MTNSGEPYETLIEGGKHWSFTMRGGTQLRLVDRDGGANVGMLFYNPFNTLERYNAPDTLKCQYTFKLTNGHCLYSDMGTNLLLDRRRFRGLARHGVRHIEQEVGRCAGGVSAATSNTATIGHRTATTPSWSRAASTVSGRRDLAANVNWFSKVAAAADGTLEFDSSNSPAGAIVDLRFEMDTLVLLHTCPHPLNAAASYPRSPVLLALQQGIRLADDDFCLNSRPENARGFDNTELYHRLLRRGCMPCA